MKQLIKITDGLTGKKREILAEIFSGLAIHRSIEKWQKTWAVTHIKSGYALYQYFPLKRQAKEFVRQIADVTDWTQCQSRVTTPAIATLCGNAARSIVKNV